MILSGFALTKIINHCISSAHAIARDRSLRLIHLKIAVTFMTQFPDRPILPITIVPKGGRREKTGGNTSSETLSDLRHWQIEEFLRQTGTDNTQRSYKRQLKNFSSWGNKFWLDVTPGDIGKYRRDLLHQELKPASINHAFNTLRAFYQWLRRSNGYPMN